MVGSRAAGAVGHPALPPRLKSAEHGCGDRRSCARGGRVQLCLWRSSVRCRSWLPLVQPSRSRTAWKTPASSRAHFNGDTVWPIARRSPHEYTLTVFRGLCNVWRSHGTTDHANVCRCGSIAEHSFSVHLIALSHMAVHAAPRRAQRADLRIHTDEHPDDLRCCTLRHNRHPCICSLWDHVGGLCLLKVWWTCLSDVP